MKKLLIVCCFLFISNCIYSQQWHSLPNSLATGYPVGLGSPCLGCGSVYSFKVINNKLYLGGAFGSGKIGDGIATYDGISWDSLGCGLAQVEDIESYNGKIYAGGGFPYYYHPPTCNGAGPGDSSSAHFARYTGSYWQPIDTNFSNIFGGFVHCMARYNSDLYIGGDIYSGSYHFVLKYNGSTLDNLLGGVDGFPGTVWDMAIYKGQLIVCGEFQNAQNNTVQVNHIARWNGTKWDSLGNGLNAGANALEVDTVNDILYVAGGFTMAGGVPVKYVAKWDGTSWLSVPPFPVADSPISKAFKMFNGKLYAGTRGVSLPSSPLDTTFLFLDNTGWHKVWGPDNNVNALEVYNGNLYVGGSFEKVDTTTVNYIACYGDSCPGNLINVTVGIHGLLNENIKFKIFPNPAKAEINILIDQKGNKEYTLNIFDIFGSKILERKISKQTNINTSCFSKGIYQVQVCDGNGTFCHTEKVVIR